MEYLMIREPGAWEPGNSNANLTGATTVVCIVYECDNYQCWFPNVNRRLVSVLKTEG